LRAPAHRITLGVFATLAVAGVAAPSTAQPRKPPPVHRELSPDLVGLTEVASLVPDQGYFDDPVDGDATRVVVVVIEHGQSVARVLSTADGRELARVDLAPVAALIRRVYLLGDRLFVVGDGERLSQVEGALVDFHGKVVRRHGPATDLYVREVGGVPAVVAYTRDPGARGGDLHQAQVYDLTTGKKRGKPGRLVLGSDHRDRKLDFRLDYFLDDHTVAVGVKGGVWRKRENQRSPDTAAAFDLLANKFVVNRPIRDLMEHARRTEAMVDHPERVFVRVRDDRSAVELWRDGAPAPLALDQPFEIYDPLTVHYGWRGERLWMSLQVDPVNPPAVARRKTDAVYVDLFEIDGGRAVRKARILAGSRKLRWGWAGDTLWVMERNLGFDRGAKALTLYRLDG